MEGTRPAGPGDTEHCRAILNDALDDLGTQRGGAQLRGITSVADLLARWSAPDGSAVLMVGEFEGVVVGLGAATVSQRPGSARPTGTIDCCYVEAAARGVGVGSALMQSLVDWCRQRGCGDVDALALPGDRSTKQRLEAAGFTARLLTLSRSLD